MAPGGCETDPNAPCWTDGDATLCCCAWPCVAAGPPVELSIEAGEKFELRR